MFLFDRNEKVKGKRNEGESGTIPEMGMARVERTLLSAAVDFA
jgi:hypothetical protein